MFDDAKERALMARIAEGDGRAFEALYEIYAKPVTNFLYRMCYDTALAEDCLQEVFMRIWKHAPIWRGQCKVSTFIFQVAKNYGLNARDKAARYRTRYGNGHRDEDEPGGAAMGEPVAEAAGPAGTLAGEELRTLVRSAIETLPEDQRVVVHLSQVQGLTYREIAEVLQVPTGTVKSRMAAAADALRRKLERHVRP